MEGEFKGTLGPWKICGDKRGGCICGQVWSIPADFPVATATSSDDELGEIPIEQMKANARLIAAALDLLEVVETFLSNYEGLKKVNNPEDSYALEVWGKLATAARAAISKALNQEV